MKNDYVKLCGIAMDGKLPLGEFGIQSLSLINPELSFEMISNDRH